MDFDRLTITLLERRSDAPELSPEQQDALQDAHMAHLADLHEAGHLLAAGPLLDRDSPFRGLSILAVGVEEARALKERDPAVRAGIYRIIALPWMVPAGAMTFTPTRFPRSISEAAET
ncbi:MAG TPA: YciI family protein [Streptosporangiaceae bacterium]|nr:YciI family protein [Streptosporangiaceae bacterium]